jgi:hypothetical protein
MAARRKAPVVLAVVLTLAIAGTALAAARGTTLKMGVLNSLTGNYITSFYSVVGGPAYVFRNGSTLLGSSAIRAWAPYGGTPLELFARAGYPVMRVSNAVKVVNLHADLLDTFSASLANVANTIPVRDGSGAIAANLNGNATSATNADKLDGVDSAGFARGGGTVVSRTSWIMVAGTTETLDLPDLGQMAMTCNANYTWATSFTTWYGPADTWVDTGATDPSFQRITVGTTRTVTSASNDRLVWDITSRNVVAASISISLYAPNPASPGRCEYSAIGLVRNNP